MEVWPFSLLVVGGVDESGAESTDSAVQSSFEDPLSCYSHSTPGMLVSDYVFLFRVQLVDEKTQEGKRKYYVFWIFLVLIHVVLFSKYGELVAAEPISLIWLILELP